MSSKTIKNTSQKRTELSDYMKGKIVGAFDSGTSMAEIARRYNIPYPTVKATMQRVKKTGTSLVKKRQGRPCLLKDRDLKYLSNIVRKDPTATLDTITDEIQTSSGVEIKRDAIRKYLKKLGIRSCIAARKPLLLERHIKKRLRFANEARRRNQQWNRVIWSDESRFMVFPRAGNVCVCRTKQQKFRRGYVVPKVQGGWGSVMVRSLKQRKHGEFIFQEDSAPCNKSLLAEEYKKKRTYGPTWNIS